MKPEVAKSDQSPWKLHDEDNIDVLVNEALKFWDPKSHGIR